MKPKDWLKRIGLTLVFFYVEVILVSKIILRAFPTIPEWLVAFGCYWAFTYVVLLIWTKPKYALRFSLTVFGLFLLLLPMKMLEANGALASVHVMANELVRLMRSPALPVIGLGVYFIKTKVFPKV